MNKAFSLLEVIIVFSIMLVLLGGGFISYTRLNAGSVLTKDVGAFVDVLNLAREKTIARDLGDTLNCSQFLGYRVRVNPANSQYQLHRLCSGLTVPVIATYQLKAAQITGSAFDVDFQYPYATIGAGRTVILTSPRVSDCHQVHIDTSGVITDNPCP